MKKYLIQLLQRTKRRSKCARNLRSKTGAHCAPLQLASGIKVGANIVRPPSRLPVVARAHTVRPYTRPPG